MEKTIAKLAFAAIWIFIFYQLLFNPEIRVPLLFFCIKHHVLAPFLLVLLQVAFASFALPCSPLTVLAGVLWGFEIGILYATTATIISSMWTFVLGRFVFGKWLKRKVKHNLWLKTMGYIYRYKWKASMIAHANPIFPGSSLGYIFGISNIEFFPFIFGALAGTLPLQLLMVGFGYFTVASIATYDAELLLIAGGLIIAIGGYILFAPLLIGDKAKEDI